MVILWRFLFLPFGLLQDVDMGRKTNKQKADDLLANGKTEDDYNKT